jgi:phage gp46-like protein
MTHMKGLIAGDGGDLGNEKTIGSRLWLLRREN